MAEMRRFLLADFLCLLLVLGVAAGTRAFYLMTCCARAANSGPLRVQEPAIWPGGVTGDKLQRDLIAAVKENGFHCEAPFAPEDEATAHVAPGYPYLVGLLAKVAPAENLETLVRWIQAGLGSLAAGLYFLFARRAFRSLAAGTLAGLFAAVNPFWIISTATIDDGTLAIFALAGCLFLAGQAGEKGGAFPSLILGLALAGLALVRASFLPFSFAAMIWFLVRSRSLERGWLCALVAFLGFLTGLAPWTVRNARTLKEPLPVVSSVYLHLYIGNNPRADGGPASEDRTWKYAPAVELRQVEGQAARYARLGPYVLKEIREYPVAALLRRLNAFLGFWLGGRFQRGEFAEETPVFASAEQEGVPSWLTERYSGTLFWWTLTLSGLALVGWRWSYGWRWESFPATLAIFFVPLPYVLSHCEGLSGPRLPLDGVLMCYAAFVIAALLPGSTLLSADQAGPPPEKEEG